MSDSILAIALLALTAIMGGIVFGYAAHVYLTVLEQTAAGGQRIDWPDEPFIDWFWKGGYLLWLSAIWLAPAALVLRPLDLPLASKLALAGGWFTLFFPIGLLSSLGASTKLAVLSWTVLRQLLAIWPRVLTFYLLTALLLAAGLALVWLTASCAPGSIVSWLVMLPLKGLAWTLGLLAHARLLGRLGFLLNYGLWRRRPRAAKPLPPAPPSVLELSKTETNGEVFGLVEPDAVALTVAEEDSGEEVEEELEPRPTLLPLLERGSFAFLSQAASWGVAVWLTLGASLLGALSRVLVMLWTKMGLRP